MVQWDLPVRFVQVDDIRIGFMEIGEGEPLILVMGLGATMDLWDPRFVKALGRRHRVIMFDNRGMGHTETGKRPFSYDQFADDTSGFINALGLDKADVLGWSMGANVAMELAIRHPSVVRRLVIYAGSCGGKMEVPSPPEIVEMVSRDDVTTEEVVRSMFPDPWNETHPDIWEFCPMERKMSDPEELVKQMEAADAWAGCFDGLKDISSQTLILNGDADLHCPLDNGILLNMEIPRSRMVLFKGAGHGMMYQMPEELADTVDYFLGGRCLTRKE